MKRLLICIISVFVLSIAYAQKDEAQVIQRTFLNCTIGETTLSKAKKALKKQGYTLITQKKGKIEHIMIIETLNPSGVYFGGHDWNSVLLRFYEKKLYYVMFSKGIKTSKPNEDIDFMNIITKKLKEKYGSNKYVLLTEKTDNFTVIDPYTLIILSKNGIGDETLGITGSVVLVYTDGDLFYKIDESENDEF
ncbi:MAG: hypothetical protein J5720_08475 [Bacteroidaceae bacterium]|nr:hypothetical protein [Bacteroidaceae bacterium]